jgi:hypothetical protein
MLDVDDDSQDNGSQDNDSQGGGIGIIDGLINDIII